MQEFGTSAFIYERLGFYCKTGRLKLIFQPPCYYFTTVNYSFEVFPRLDSFSKRECTGGTRPMRK